MEFNIKDLPYKSFEKLGMSKRDILNLPKDDLVALLSGKTTSLKPIHIKDNGIDYKADVKLSLYNLPDNSIGVKVHPYRKEIKNEYNLTQNELTKLQNGELVVGTRVSMNGEKDKYIYQLDKEINEIKSIRVNNIKIPDQVNTILLSPDQKNALLEGKHVKVTDKDNNGKTLAIDLINIKGFTLKEDLSQGKKKGVGKKAEVEDSPKNQSDRSIEKPQKITMKR
ncbi:DUF4099 domain-containing protein [Chondrinema litorale]|uniref:DUF4099 domain-containing protein n=1 Tax=Chondrinema litorale TaxID=2994555 RepID=UPI002543C8AE|nr:DUF4099 domain-containing protein [Chondrinema litorale]UZR99608.1 DUF4099 domain-containing protein [Chondrinema litorale]